MYYYYLKVKVLKSFVFNTTIIELQQWFIKYILHFYNAIKSTNLFERNQIHIIHF